MILDHLEHAERYVGLHPAFGQAFEFLRQGNLAELPPGRHEVDGDRLYAMVIQGPGKGQEEARLEVHRRYIDIQFSVCGADLIGWKPTGRCSAPEENFDADKDLGFHPDAPDAWIAVNPGAFAVFYPEDAHAPMAATGELHKVVMKVAVDH